MATVRTLRAGPLTVELGTRRVLVTDGKSEHELEASYDCWLTVLELVKAFAPRRVDYDEPEPAP